MTRKGARSALFEAYEQPPSAEQQQALALLEEVAGKLQQAQNPLCQKFTEFELDELADILQRGARPAVEFEPDLAVMAMKAAETSRLACLAALELLEPGLRNIRESRERRNTP